MLNAPRSNKPTTWGGPQKPAPWSLRRKIMKIKNNNAKQLTVLLNNKAYVFNPGDSLEVPETEGNFILSIQPLLTAVKAETVEIHSEPVKIETPKVAKPKAKKNVKNKKSGK